MAPDPSDNLLSAVEALTDILTRNLDFQMEQQREAEHAAIEGNPILSAASRVQDVVQPRPIDPRYQSAQPGEQLPLDRSFQGTRGSWTVQREPPEIQPPPRDPAWGPPGPSPTSLDDGPAPSGRLDPASQANDDRSYRQRLNDAASNARQQREAGNQDEDTRNMLTWAMLGEHGGPGFVRNRALDMWGQQRSVEWGQNVFQGLSGSLENAQGSDGWQGSLANAAGRIGINPQNLESVNNVLDLARAHPYATYAATAAVAGGVHAFQNMRAGLQTSQALGQSFGYGPPPLGQTLFGFRNPMGDVSSAAQVGAAFNIENAGLTGRIPGMGFGSGLSSEQARDVTGTLAGQGFAMSPLGGGGIEGGILSALSHMPGGNYAAGLITSLFGGGPTGDAASLSQNLMRPLIQAFPGISGQDLSQFTPAVRNSGTSIQQLVDSLHNLGTEAQSAKETVGQFTSGVAQTAQTFQSMGASAHGGIGVGTGFANATGLDSQFAAQFAQSPLVQGLALSQYGVLPSGLGDMNPGAFTNMSLQSLQMLQRATSGLNRNRYATINGRQVLVEAGQQQQYDQMSSMTGIPSDIIKRMLGDQGAIQARSMATEAIGDATQSTGIWQMLNQTHGRPLNSQQYSAATNQWSTTVDPYLRQAVGAQEARRIDSISGLRDRAKAAAQAISQSNQSDVWNQINNTPNAQTVQVQFTGLAAKFFQQSNTSASKIAANAGATAQGYNSIFNSTTGDTSILGGNDPYFLSGDQTGMSLNGGVAGMSLNGDQTGISLG